MKRNWKIKKDTVERDIDNVLLACGIKDAEHAEIFLGCNQIRRKNDKAWACVNIQSYFDIDTDITRDCDIIIHVEATGSICRASGNATAEDLIEASEEIARVAKAVDIINSMKLWFVAEQ